MSSFQNPLACLVAVALLLPSAPLLAGTKRLTSIVPVATSSPTLLPNSKILVKDNGLLKLTLKGVQTASGALATSDKSLKSGNVTGDEYAVILSGKIIALNLEIELGVLIEMKEGKGTTKIDISHVFGLFPNGLAKTIAWGNVEVYGPVGTNNLEACQNNMDLSDGLSFPPAPHPCVGGTHIGSGGIVDP